MTHTVLRTAVVEAIAELTGCSASKISDTDSLAEDLGVDSMVAVNLILAIEDRLGSVLPDGHDSNLLDVRTVGTLVDRLAVAFLAGETEDDRSTKAERGRPR